MLVTRVSSGRVFIGGEGGSRSFLEKPRQRRLLWRQVRPLGSVVRLAWTVAVQSYSGGVLAGEGASHASWTVPCPRSLWRR